MARIETIKLRSFKVSAKSEWLFVNVKCNDGFEGVGEATMEGHETAVKAQIREIGNRLCGMSADPLDLRFPCHGTHDRAHMYTAMSAIEQALWDAHGKRQNAPVAQLLGGAVQDCRLYANINRGIEERTPQGFAQAARTAAAAGFSAVKIAPFDMLDWSTGYCNESRDKYELGLSRIAATRNALGGDILLMVDSHWRFDMQTARQLITDVIPYGLYWLECPIAENKETINDLRELRALCNDAGMLLAGLETMNGLEDFEPFLKAGAMDVVMPDIKYAGGLAQCQLIAQAADRYSINCSPHNPTGPVCHAASLHVASTLTNCPVLEHQFRETPFFETLVDGTFPALSSGLAPLPVEAGFGISLKTAAGS